MQAPLLTTQSFSARENPAAYTPLHTGARPTASPLAKLPAFSRGQRRGALCQPGRGACSKRNFANKRVEKRVLRRWRIVGRARGSPFAKKRKQRGLFRGI